MIFKFKLSFSIQSLMMFEDVEVLKEIGKRRYFKSCQCQYHVVVLDMTRNLWLLASLLVILLSLLLADL